MGQTVHVDDEIICAFLDGELTEADRQAVLAHQVVCPGCRGRTEALDSVSSLITAAATDLEAHHRSESARQAAIEAAMAGSDCGSPQVLPWETAPARRSRAAGRTAGRNPARHRRPGSTGLGAGRRMTGFAALALATAALAFGISAVALQPHHDRHTRAAAGAASTGLQSSLGSFSHTATLSSTLRAEVASLAPGSSDQILPCHRQAAAALHRPAAATVAFSAPLTYAGVPAQVFAYLTDGRSVAMAVVESDIDCTVVARLGW